MVYHAILWLVSGLFSLSLDLKDRLLLLLLANELEADEEEEDGVDAVVVVVVVVDLDEFLLFLDFFVLEDWEDELGLFVVVDFPPPAVVNGEYFLVDAVVTTLCFGFRVLLEVLLDLLMVVLGFVVVETSDLPIQAHGIQYNMYIGHIG